MERLCSWPSWISARSRSHSRKGPERPVVPPDHGCDGETVSPSLHSSSQTSAGKANYCYRDQLQTWGGGHPLSGCGLRYARLIAALLCQHGPSDPRQLVGEGSGQNVRMQALSGANEPESEAVLRPVRRPQQNDPGCLHEECSQVTVAALGDAPEDGSISGRHLLRDEAEPS